MQKLSSEECEFGLVRGKYGAQHTVKYSELFYDGSTITHYTDLLGLVGIVESGGFWLSDHRFLNDTEEFENGRKLTRSVLNALCTKFRYAGFREVLEGASSCLQDLSEEPYYVCSFSSETDSLSNWRGYADDGRGISITFDNRGEGLLGSRFFFVMPILVASKVVYENRAKITTIVRTIRRFAREFATDIKAGREVWPREWSGDLSRMLAVKFINFKHPQYAAEHEIRLVVPTSHVKSFNGLKHRVKSDRIIPYADLVELYAKLSLYEDKENRRLPIREVRVGPTANQEVTLRSVSEYLHNKGYDSVRICKSEVPYRG